MFDFIATLLSFFYDLWPSYGGAIVLLTLLIVLVFSPLQIKATRSMLQMQRLAPEIKRLQAEHRGDRETLNREMMALYQANKVNPVGGCLPMLLQIPVFIVLFQVLQGLTNRVSSTGLAMGSTLVQGGGVAVDFPKRTFDPRYLSKDSSLYESLRGSTEMSSWGLDLSSSARAVIGDSIVNSIPYLLLVVLVGVTAYIQQKQIMARSTGAQAINPQQQMIMKFLPFMLPIFSFSFPAGLVLYFLVSNVARIGQQAFITRRVYAPMKADGTEIVMPEKSAEKTVETPKSKPSRGQAANERGGRHGRRPVTAPPKKPVKRTAERQTDNRAARPASGRVTPKGETTQAKRKKKR